jgi:F-type H+-transporting ATPase subunit b
MLIDWFTVIAQITNFLILVWLMKRYLYHPILAAIDAREKRLATQLSDAETKVKDAAKERELFVQKSQVLDQDRDRLMKAAQDAAEVEKLKLLEAARQEANAMRAKRNDALVNESKALEHELATLIQNEVFSIARQTLSDLADITLETQMSKVFIQHLNALDGKSKDALLAAVKSVPQSLQLRSAYELALPEQEAISKALNGVTGIDLNIKFEVASGLGCGIELTANGQKLAWSTGAYLNSLDSQINTLLSPVISDADKVQTPSIPNS